jgi:hypothetical protein
MSGVLVSHGERLAHMEHRLATIEQTLSTRSALSRSDCQGYDSLARHNQRLERCPELRDAQ